MSKIGKKKPKAGDAPGGAGEAKKGVTVNTFKSSGGEKHTPGGGFSEQEIEFMKKAI